MRAQEFVKDVEGIDVSLEIQKDDAYVDDDDTDNQVVFVKATSNGRELGHVLFTMSYDGQGLILNPQDLEVDERYRGQGIAKIMYDFVKSKGYRIRRSGQQTDAGEAFWQRHRPGQNVWENQIDEIRGPNVAYQHLVPDIVADFQKGMSITDLQKKYSIAGPTIKNAIRRVIGDQEFQKIMDYRYGKGIGQKRNTSADVIAKMAQEYAQGSSMDEIAQHFSISPASVQRYLSALPNRNELHRSFLIARNKFEDVNENFADGKKPGRKGLSKRVGIPKKTTLGQLEKIAQSSTGEKRRMAQWQLNMRRGRAKKAK
jgi:Mor family transcriptional regulator